MNARTASVFVALSGWNIMAAPGSITVSIYNLGDIGPHDLAQAELLATGLFATAGIHSRWTKGLVTNSDDLLIDFSAARSLQCTAPLQPTVVRVQILAHAPDGFSSRALGFALPCAARGMQVTLYADRIESVSRSTPLDFCRVLGYALAHEIGHVLLRSSAHGDSGLMKGVWSRSDWERAAFEIIPFTQDQARSMAGFSVSATAALR